MKIVWKRVISAVLCISLLSVFAILPASAEEITVPKGVQSMEEPYAQGGIKAYRHLSSNTFYLSTNIETNLTDVTQYEISYVYKLYDYEGTMYCQSSTAPHVYSGPELIGYSPEVLNFPNMSSATKKLEVSMQVVLYSASNGVLLAKSPFMQLQF